MTTATAAKPRPSDAELARRIGQRDERAFEAMMREHNRLLYRIARSILKDDAEAEDAVQDAYLAAYQGIGSYRGGAKLSTWLARIVINESYMRLRKQKRAGVVVPLEAADRRPEEGIMIEDTAERPEAAAMRAELRRILEQRIDSLPEQFRLVFMLREVEEMSVDEAAECLELPPATVRTRAFRARAMLRESLSRDFDAAAVDAFGFAGERCDRIVANVLARIRSLNP